jgi:hypothetical protein
MNGLPTSELRDEELYVAMCEQGVLVALVQAPWRFAFEIRTLDPALFEWRAHREIAAAIRRVADNGRYAHYRRVRRLLRSEGPIQILDAFAFASAAHGNVAGLIGELQRLKRLRRGRPPAVGYPASGSANLGARAHPIDPPPFSNQDATRCRGPQR